MIPLTGIHFVLLVAGLYARTLPLNIRPFGTQMNSLFGSVTQNLMGADHSQGPRCGLGYTQGGCFGKVCRVQLEGAETPAHSMPFGWACIMPAHPGRLHPQMVHHLSVAGPSPVADPNRK